MAGKWAYLKDKFPKMPIDADYVQKLDAILDAPSVEGSAIKVRDLANDELLPRYHDARNQKDKIVAMLSVLDLEIEAYTRLFVDRFESDGVASTKFTDGTTLTISDEPYPFVADREKFMAWVHANDLASMLTMNPQTMKSLVKERLTSKTNEPLPDGVDVFMKTSLSRRGGPKA